MRLWDIANGKLVGAVELQKSFSNGVALSPDGRIAYYGGTDGMLRAHDFAADAPVFTSAGNGWIEDVDASADLVVSGGRGKSVVVWNAKTGEQLRSVELGANISMVGISPDNRFATALSGKRPPPIWDITTGKLVGVLVGHDGAVSSIRFGHDSRTIATIDSVAKKLRVFDLPV